MKLSFPTGPYTSAPKICRQACLQGECLWQWPSLNLSSLSQTVSHAWASSTRCKDSHPTLLPPPPFCSCWCTHIRGSDPGQKSWAAVGKEVEEGGDNSHTSGSRMLTHRPCSLHGHTDTTWGRNQSKQLQLAPPFKNCTWIAQPRSQNYFLASPYGAQTRWKFRGVVSKCL